jgi:nitrogen fixation/metabolism regulation signal transduction histidine kinase
MQVSVDSSRMERVRIIVGNLTRQVSMLPEDERLAALSSLQELTAEIDGLSAVNTSLQQKIHEVRTTAIHLESTINSVTAGVIVFDREGRVQTSNSSIIALFGFDPMNMTRQKIFNRLSIYDEDGLPMSPQLIPGGLFRLTKLYSTARWC